MLRGVGLAGHSEHAAVRAKNGNTILTFCSRVEEEHEVVRGEGLLATMVTVRAELLRGDLRALYLGWLLSAQSGVLSDDDKEPAVPRGFNQLSASLESMREFLVNPVGSNSALPVRCLEGVAGQRSPRLRQSEAP